MHSHPWCGLSCHGLLDLKLSLIDVIVRAFKASIALSITGHDLPVAVVYEAVWRRSRCREDHVQPQQDWSCFTRINWNTLGVGLYQGVLMLISDKSGSFYIGYAFLKAF